MSRRERKIWALALVVTLSVVAALVAGISMIMTGATPKEWLTAGGSAFAVALTLGLGVLAFVFT
ncbi:hypothetical protein [Streptomyces sioyaensis]|uniref:hypothetical protein n=1 Tax=Streptomyces TaxID=1883 RepID=UPI0036E8E5FE